MESSILLTYRHNGDPSRLANLQTVLQWLAANTSSELLVLEQDAYPTLAPPEPGRAGACTSPTTPAPSTRPGA
jgi:hypothetical protein